MVIIWKIRIEGSLNHVQVILFVENPIASEHHKVVFLTDVEFFDFRLADNTTRVTSVNLKFGIHIANGSTHGKSSRKHSIRSKDNSFVLMVVTRLPDKTLIDLASIALNAFHFYIQ